MLTDDELRLYDIPEYIVYRQEILKRLGSFFSGKKVIERIENRILCAGYYRLKKPTCRLCSTFYNKFNIIDTCGAHNERKV